MDATFNHRALADVAVRVSGAGSMGTDAFDEQIFFLNRFPLLSRSGYFKDVFLKMAAVKGGAPLTRTLPAGPDGACCRRLQRVHCVYIAVVMWCPLVHVSAAVTMRRGRRVRSIPPPPVPVTAWEVTRVRDVPAVA